MNRAQDNAPRAAVPADIDAPDRIVWGLTFRQVAILAVAALVGYGVYRMVGHLVPPAVLLVVAVPCAGVVGAVALGRRDGRSLDVWLLSALRLYRTPRVQAPAGGAASGAGLVAVTGSVTAPALLRLPADAISDTGVLSIGDTQAVVVATGTVHLGLRTGEEQAAVLDGFGRWLNSLTAPVQIVVSTQRVDLAPAAAHLYAQAPLLPHPALTAAAQDHAAFLTDLTASRDPLRRHVLVLVRADPGDPRGATRRGEDTARAMAALGVHARPLDGPSYTAALAAAVDPYTPRVPGVRATPDAVITTDRS
jgi:hypothetical protein